MRKIPLKINSENEKFPIPEKEKTKLPTPSALHCAETYFLWKSLDGQIHEEHDAQL